MNVWAEKCWEMVLQRLKQEIRTHNLGTPLVLQPLSFVDGLEMFGFLSSTIVWAIEALDPHCQCIEYWSNRLLIKNYLEAQSSEGVVTDNHGN